MACTARRSRPSGLPSARRLPASPTSIAALSKSAVLCVWEVNIDGLAVLQQVRPAVRGLFLRLVERGHGLRVAAGCRDAEAGRLAGLGAKMMVPSGDQLAPRLRVTLVSVSGVPPLTGTLRISDDVT